ncbi:Na/Pi symporter [Algoriphagus boritolerans]|uniref:Solute carrier family 34 (Sodium-dependent phosphate cotransporter) n=1 Tax=Algoriphagus boritolerans DSM 17298 = JCM 18970 TaxID=1120964 RepID=A0A1H6AE99_9BACT|nr:Na/Pi symporter [Algoriphagus boritolerans]SEG46076.1 solute carrier family 34 (sodium-dependent phosphate cotransporter) [Algoriphagus boritolerans DSM 17298 = JCM 18970]
MEELVREKTTGDKIRNYLIVSFSLLLFIFAIDLLTVTLGRLNNDVAKDIIQATRNPFISLFVGLLVTALIQSSSTVTASIVAIVASGNMTLQQAVPMVLGANIGTTLTSTLVSFTFITKKKEFKRALSSGISHDMFNILNVIILFPLELSFNFLSKTAAKLATYFVSDEEVSGTFEYNRIFTRGATEWIVENINIPFLSTILAIFLVFFSIKIMTTSVYKTFVLDAFQDISKVIFKNTGMSFLYGIFFTAAVQSSTVTTCLVVPLVANRRVSLAKSFPFIIGANIGTTITAIIASMYKTEAAIALAIAHVLFNSIGALIFLPFPEVRQIPIKLAEFMGKTSVRNRFFGFAYILLTFFIIPFLLIYFGTD